jgi:hypothetical protein
MLVVQGIAQEANVKLRSWAPNTVRNIARRA